MTVVETPPTEAPEPAPRPAPARRPGLNTETIALGALFIAVFAFLAATFAVAMAARATDEARSGGGGGGAAASAGGGVEVDLMEFMIMPEDVQVPAGTASLHVVNAGAVEHTLAVEGGNETPVLAGGETAELDISGLAPGTYELTCTIAGHVESGMTGSLTIT